MGPSATLRPARLADLAALGRLKLRASLAWGDFVAELQAMPEAATVEAEHLPGVFVAEREGVLLGFGTVLPREDGAVEIEDLFVEPDAWGQGLGSRLLAEAERRAAALGGSRLEVIASRHAAPFYQARGFTLVRWVQTLLEPAPELSKPLA